MSEFAFTTTTASTTARFHDTVSMTKIDQLLGGIAADNAAVLASVEYDTVKHHANQLDAKVLALAEEMIKQMYDHMPLEARHQMIHAKATAITYLDSMRMHLEQDVAVGTTLPNK